MSVVCLNDHHPDTDRQRSQQPPEPDPRTIALLMDPDVGITDRDIAAKLAQTHTFDWIQRTVATWYMQVQTGKSTGTGGLINRLDLRWGPGPFPEKFRLTDLYQRHWAQTDTDDTWANDHNHEAPAPPPPAPPLPRQDPTSTEALLWSTILNDLALQMTQHTFDTWVANTQLHSLDDNTAVILAPSPPVQEWLDDHLNATIRRSLSRCLRRSVTIRITIPKGDLAP